VIKVDARDLCWQLMQADTEDDVVAILREAGYWDDPEYWRYVADDDNNFATVGNQQAESIAAMIEKIINGVDARLTNACLIAGIDPTSPEAPQSIREAVARFFEGKPDDSSDRAGRVAFWDDSKTTDEGRLLTVAATGNKPESGWPSISIADGGEGQTPDSFPDTFTSLHRSNKLRIPFVQGKFNMGGTGALQFCSQRHRLQLIVSRRNPALLPPGASERDQQWGFTVVRRETPTGSERSSVFTYLAPVAASPPRRGAVLAFEAEVWPLFPTADSSGRGAYERPATYGSLIKLYEYRWQGTKSNIVRSGDGLLRRLDQGLPELALPVRLYECRQGYSGHAGSFATNLLGLSARLERDKAEKLEEEFPVGSIIDMDGHKVIVKVFAFKKGQADQYRTARNGVIFTINGQAHATLSVDLFRRKQVAMSYLADSLLVTVDCSAIDGAMREDLFMNSRDRLRDNALSRRLEDELESLLRDDPALRALRNRRRQEDLADKLSEDKPLAEALEEILKRSPTLEKLFLQGHRLTSPFPSDGAGRGGGGKFQGKSFPTFFRFKGKQQGEELKRGVRLGSRARVAFETDAEDAYFVRDVDPGEWSVWRIIDGETPTQLPNCRLDGPRSGIATLHLELPNEVAEGDTLVLDVEVSDISRVDPFVNRLMLDMEPPTSSSPGGDGKRSRSATTGNGVRGTTGSLALPEVKRVHEDEWHRLSFHTFTEDTALAIVRADDDDHDVFDFYVNVDNKYVRAVQKESKENPRLLEEKFVYSMVLVGLALILDDHNSKRPVNGDNKNNAGTEESIERFVARVTTTLAPVILPMIDVVGSLSLDSLHDE
jgi:hypothetical protein